MTSNRLSDFERGVLLKFQDIDNKLRRLSTPLGTAPTTPGGGPEAHVWCFAKTKNTITSGDDDRADFDGQQIASGSLSTGVNNWRWSPTPVVGMFYVSATLWVGSLGNTVNAGETVSFDLWRNTIGTGHILYANLDLWTAPATTDPVEFYLQGSSFVYLDGSGTSYIYCKITNNTSVSLEHGGSSTSTNYDQEDAVPLESHIEVTGIYPF